MFKYLLFLTVIVVANSDLIEQFLNTGPWLSVVQYARKYKVDHRGCLWLNVTRKENEFAVCGERTDIPIVDFPAIGAVPVVAVGSQEELEIAKPMQCTYSTDNNLLRNLKMLIKEVKKDYILLVAANTANPKKPRYGHGIFGKNPPTLEELQEMMEGIEGLSKPGRKMCYQDE